MKHLLKTRLAATLCALLAASYLSAQVVIRDGDSIAFLGDSITYLGNKEKPNGYVNLVIEGLTEAGIEVTAIPAGIGGNTTVDMLARLNEDVISQHPTWMTLNSGINDTPKLSVEEFGANIREITDRAQAAGIQVILLNTTIGAGENLNHPSNLKRLKYCQEFEKLAEEKGLILVDLNGAMTRALERLEQDGGAGLKLTHDGTHLNGLGNQIVATEILRTLGVSETDIEILQNRWDDYPFAVAMPEVSVRTYIALDRMAKQENKPIDAIVSQILTQSLEETE